MYESATGLAVSCMKERVSDAVTVKMVVRVTSKSVVASMVWKAIATREWYTLEI